jgi:radical SAM superfamily enzyme YgiQ (UPF0313 family)
MMESFCSNDGEDAVFMRVNLILPALTEAHGRYWRSIKYSLFPPLGLATLAGWLGPEDEATLVDEHVETLSTDDEPDLVAIEVYVTSARRAYRIADTYRTRGIHVVLGGLHPTACPEEASLHADTLVLGPAEEAWPRFLADFRAGRAAPLYTSRTRDLDSLPRPRRDLINRRLYLVPNSMVVSRGCPHACDFCYSNSFFRGGRRFYTVRIDQALAEIETLPGRHLFFLDDNIFGDPAFAAFLFRGMRGMRRIWQGAATVKSILDVDLLDLAVESGLASLFIGFESLNQEAVRRHGKRHNDVVEYERAIRLLQERGVMVNASFVFGVDEDEPDVFDSTVAWAVERGIETATFHILTPYPGTDLYERCAADGRLRHRDWDLYDTRHAVFEHPRMSSEQLEAGYWRAYENFYSWRGIMKSAAQKAGSIAKARHAAYVVAWKKMDPLWSLVIGLKKLPLALPPLEWALRAGKAAFHKPLDIPVKEKA